MKKKYLVAATGLALLGLSLSACSSNSSSKGNSEKTTEQYKKKNEVISQNKELREKFDQIKVGNFLSQGEGGSTTDEVKQLLGNPTSSTTTSSNGVKVKQLTWTKGAVTVAIQTLDSNKVVSKEITGFKWGKRDEKITLGEFNNIADGSTYQDIVNKYGEPDGLHEANVTGTKITNAVWLTGIKGDDGASATLSFENDKLTTKSQTKLK